MKRSLFAPLVLAAAAATALAGAGAGVGCNNGSFGTPADMRAPADPASPLLSCSMTIDEYCATANANCIRDFNLADTNGAWCSDGGVIISATRKFCRQRGLRDHRAVLRHVDRLHVSIAPALRDLYAGPARAGLHVPRRPVAGPAADRLHHAAPLLHVDVAVAA